MSTSKAKKKQFEAYRDSRMRARMLIQLACALLALAAVSCHTLPNGKVIGGKAYKEGQELDTEQESALPDTSGRLADGTRASMSVPCLRRCAPEWPGRRALTEVGAAVQTHRR